VADSLTLTSNLPFSDWGTVFGDEAVGATDTRRRAAGFLQQWQQAQT